MFSRTFSTISFSEIKEQLSGSVFDKKWENNFADLIILSQKLNSILDGTDTASFFSGFPTDDWILVDFPPARLQHYIWLSKGAKEIGIFFSTGKKKFIIFPEDEEANELYHFSCFLPSENFKMIVDNNSTFKYLENYALLYNIFNCLSNYQFPLVKIGN